MNITLTNHAKYSLNKRKILENELVDAVKYPDKIIKKYGKHFFEKTIHRGKIEAVCEKTERNIKVITVYWI